MPTLLSEFLAYAYERGLDISGDATRFYRLTTARAWTRFYEQHSKG